MKPGFRELYNKYKTKEAKQLIDYMFGMAQRVHKEGLLGQPLDLDYVLDIIKTCADDMEYLKLIDEVNK